MPETVESLVAEFAEERQQITHVTTGLAGRAQAAGFSQLAKFFRAMTASEAVRSKLILGGMNAHAEENPDLFICPHCGLVFLVGAPEACPVDETPGSLFEKIS
jgi:rubrerythrin